MYSQLSSYYTIWSPKADEILLQQVLRSSGNSIIPPYVYSRDFVIEKIYHPETLLQIPECLVPGKKNGKICNLQDFLENNYSLLGMHFFLMAFYESALKRNKRKITKRVTKHLQLKAF